MSHPSNADTPMSNYNIDLLSNLPTNQLQKLLSLCASDTGPANPPPAMPFNLSRASRGEVRLPKWNGKKEEFKFYMARLKTRIEREMQGVFEEDTICLDMVDTLPNDLQAKTEEWFDERQRGEDYSWRKLLDHFSELFGDHQALETAVENFNRTRQGPNQYFQDYIKEFEYRVALCGGEETYTPQGKSLHLRLSLNNRLKKALIGVSLPNPKDYRAYVNEIRKVASDLERFEDYRSRGIIHNENLRSSHGNSMGEAREQLIDTDGDVKMGGVNAIKTRNVEKKLPVLDKKTPIKPRAPWRSLKDFNRLLEQGKCVRCTSGEHKANNCQKYRPAIRTTGMVNAVDAEFVDNDSSESGKDEP
ncbi:hypothetical protein GcM3_133014 [Golovinomyces cichoracearum]|uniref:Retrotransposon gag domain-containing protein n=1 Tax=Golovinomyces cichoracearum TaxID=62708 RepID=A0A420I3S7_9PEZI|nr:hypothetical protein GcM3_133014 [Golovinomyces cichoracearum]